jgi:hypothetical protein
MAATHLEARIDRIGACLSELKRRLQHRGYLFQDDEASLPGPIANVSVVTARIEREVGAVPLALRLFYERVGSVNFLGTHPDWTGCEYPDAIVIDPPAAILCELDDYLYDPETYKAAYGTLCLPIAPDYYHKENVSGGPAYSVAVPGDDDPPFLNEWHHVSFVDYLEIAVRWGGFPGLERCPDHNWPIPDLTAGLTFTA